MQTANQILRRGSTGNDVKNLQELLNYVYRPELKVDGIFGATTEAAVKKFQKEYGLTVDGIAGPNTLNRLKQIRNAPVTPTPLPILRRGSTDSYVKYLQDILNRLGYSVVADGSFGAKTEVAVKKFQQDYGLVADGIVGAKTWSMLEYQIHD